MPIETNPTRRDLIVSCGSVIATGLLPLTIGQAYAQASSVKGQVFETVNGQRLGLARVIVTNGRECTQTNAHGFYELPIDRNCIISIVKPSGYRVAEDPLTHLPKFYYIHQPEGTPADLKFTYEGLQPTGALPQNVDFNLISQAESQAFKVILFGDPQPENDTEVNFIRDGVIPKLIGTDAQFGITLGDIVGDDLSLYPRLSSIIGMIGIPWYQVCGNHDLNYEAKDNVFARDTFKRHFGPSHYAFEYGNALFVVLQNIVYHGHDPSEPDGQGTYHEELSAEQLQFAKSIIERTAEDKLIVFLCHAPLKSSKNKFGIDIASEDTLALLSLTQNRKSISFAGHTHRMEHKYISLPNDPFGQKSHHHHVLTTLCGSWWSGPNSPDGIAYADACDGSPNGYYELSIKGAEYKTDFVPVSMKSEQKMRSMLAESIAADSDHTPAYRIKSNSLLSSDLTNLHLVVNFFEGGPKTHMSYAVDGRDFVPLEKTWIKDPWLKQRYSEHKGEIKPWVDSVNSSHIWVGKFANTLSLGSHKITIKAVDEFGQETRDYLCLDVVAHNQAHLLDKRR